MTLEDQFNILLQAIERIAKQSDKDCRCPFTAQRNRDLANKALTRINGQPPTERTPTNQD